MGLAPATETRQLRPAHIDDEVKDAILEDDDD
jgi:hypothetical protein